MDSDSLHRLTKALMDSGEAVTLAEAQAQFSTYGVRIVIADGALNHQSNRIIAMTAINVAARTFNGQVSIEGPLEDVLDDSVGTITLRQFANWLGLKQGQESAAWPTIIIGDSSTRGDGDIIPWARGWRFGLGHAPEPGSVFVPASVAAGALAVNEAFSLLRKDNPYSGKRTIAISLWNPLEPSSDGPSEQPIIPPIWLVGLGHLGQAYAWILGLMPNRSNLSIFLQDVDTVSTSTLSTSILTVPADIGYKKTRVIANWLEARGYQTSLIERRFDEFQRVAVNEPHIALFGVDNRAARRNIESAGFRLAIDSGLGAGYKDFRGIRVRIFPGPSKAEVLWASGSDQKVAPLAPAYENLLAQGADACGVTMLATRAVGAPFVGCVAAAFVVAELVRSSLGATRFGVVDLNLREPHIVDLEFYSEA